MILRTCDKRIVRCLKMGELKCLLKLVRKVSTGAKPQELDCDLLVVGGGAGGCSVAARFLRQSKDMKLIIIEPKSEHYYQPMFTLIAGGIRPVEDSVRPMADVLPPGAKRINDRVKTFDPDNNRVFTNEGSTITYKYMVVSCGIEVNYDDVSGLQEALKMKDSGVCSIYSPDYAVKTYKTMQSLKSGNAIFTFPNSPVKCAGAPLKVCFLSEHFARLNHRRADIKFMFRTSLPVIFAAKYYADGLVTLCDKRNIEISYRKELVAVKPKIKEATFRCLDKAYELENVQYSMLHVTPPMSPPAELKNASMLVDSSGYLDVDKATLQHVDYKNVFGLGDCTNLPTSKTAAAVSAQGSVLTQNLTSVMNSRPMGFTYNGYTSCPLVTEYGKCILAEFDYERNPLETFPIDQRKEWSLPYYLKKDVLPQVYWLAMKGYWNGPQVVRKICHLGYTP